MITYTKGNMFESDADCLVNTVNCEGFMGKGIAYQFKVRFPENNKSYIKACKSGELTVGKVHYYVEDGITIVNFPTKDKWRANSKIEYIETGMDYFIKILPQLGVKKVAIPPLGCGNGGLLWEEVKKIIEDKIVNLQDKYDFIIIDCPPSLNMLTINSMTTADSVLVPIQCEYYALEGLSQLIHTINLVKERLNPNLNIDGVVFTMYDSRTNLSMQVVENVKQNLNQKVYNTLIPRNIRLAEAPSYGMPINMYDPKSAGAEAYMQLAEEVIKNK